MTPTTRRSRSPTTTPCSPTCHSPIPDRNRKGRPRRGRPFPYVRGGARLARRGVERRRSAHAPAVVTCEETLIRRAVRGTRRPVRRRAERDRGGAAAVGAPVLE